ncbi:MAG: flagellar protein export ATPase FliI [bacterium]|jgi:flagellum-specific ATP synthase
MDNLNRTTAIDLTKYHALLRRSDPYVRRGQILSITGLTIESIGPRVDIGELCYIKGSGDHLSPAVAAGFREDRMLLLPLGEMNGVGPGCQLYAAGRPLAIPVGDDLQGRVIDVFGRPLDEAGPIRARQHYSLENSPPLPLERRSIREPLACGIRAIDGLLTCGKGQRLGIFAGSGVGKSTLLGMVARNTAADVNVIALVGERGREVRDFIENDLGKEGLRRSVIIVATSDQPAMLRVYAALAGTAVAEYFRDKGKDVLLMMDSVTRFAMAQREIGLANGEPPTTKGYPPSVFALLPRLLERAGTAEIGSITGFYTVLVDGDDMTDPIADAVRSILDGHIVLTRELANQNHYPAIDVLQSVSRLMPSVAPEAGQAAAGKVKSLLATYREAEDLVNIGAYQKGANPRIDAALESIDSINAFLRQAVAEKSDFEQTQAALSVLLS